MKSLFVSRLHPATTANDVGSALQDLKLDYVKISKMKTKSPNYSSFHIETDENEFQQLFRDDVWSEGCIITEFFGRLKEGQINEPEDIFTQGT